MLAHDAIHTREIGMATADSVETALMDGAIVVLQEERLRVRRLPLR